MGFHKGDEFDEIKLGYKHIHLIQIDGDKKETQFDQDAEIDKEDEKDEE